MLRGDEDSGAALYLLYMYTKHCMCHTTPLRGAEKHKRGAVGYGKANIICIAPILALGYGAGTFTGGRRVWFH